MSRFLLKALGGKGFIMVNKTLAKEIGLYETVLLGELISLYDLFKGEEFFFQRERLSEETSMSLRMVDKSLKNLKEIGFISITQKGLPKKSYYKVEEENIFSYLRKLETSVNENCNTSVYENVNTGVHENVETSIYDLKALSNNKDNNNKSSNNKDDNKNNPSSSFNEKELEEKKDNIEKFIYTLEKQFNTTIERIASDNIKRLCVLNEVNPLEAYDNSDYLKGLADKKPTLSMFFKEKTYQNMKMKVYENKYNQKELVSYTDEEIRKKDEAQNEVDRLLGL